MGIFGANRETPRLVGMVTMLVVLGMVVFSSRGPAKKSGPVKKAETAAPPTENNEEKSAVPEAGPTDEDPDQQAEAAEEFQVITDGSLGIQPEENFAYWRLFQWVKNQRFEQLWKRARANFVFADLVHSPAKYRGQLLRLDLNVRRVLPYDVDESPLGIKKIYEIWGFSEESQAWLYDVVAAELPQGMATGPDVYERVRFVGYFFKLQGYREAGAKPRDKLLQAPLLVGRLVRYPKLRDSQSGSSEWLMVGIIAAVVIVAMGLAGVQILAWRRAAARRAVSAQQGSESTRQWLGDGYFPGDEGFASEEKGSGAAGGNSDRSIQEIKSESKTP